MRTSLARQSTTALGIQRGEPLRFYKRHRIVKSGPGNPNWTGGVTHVKGYAQERMPDHPRANSRGYVYQHILVVERILGRYLKSTEEVHHWNCIRSDNRPENLLLCQDHAYHMLIERRGRAYDACGHADWRKCQFCKQYDDPKNLRPSYSGTTNHHIACELRNQRERKRRKREAKKRQAA